MMSSRLRKIHNNKRQSGFTLIELLVVIAILGVITAIALPNIVQFSDKGESESKLAEMHNVITAATSALKGGDGECVAEPSDGTDIIEAIPDGPANKVGSYLVNDTVWGYIVTSDGEVTQLS